MSGRDAARTTVNQLPALREAVGHFQKGPSMLELVLLIVVVLLLLGAVPAWPHSRNWGYGPSGILGVLLVIVLVVVLLRAL
jgi:hypothetical protein